MVECLPLGEAEPGGIPHAKYVRANFSVSGFFVSRSWAMSGAADYFRTLNEVCELVKQGHKYLERRPLPGGGYEYVYQHPAGAPMRPVKTGKLGVMEFMRFWGEATADQQAEMKRRLQAKDPKAVFRLLDDVVHTGIAERAMQPSAAKELDGALDLFKVLAADLEKEFETPYEVPEHAQAKPGMIHIWGDGHRYVKLPGGKWKRADTGDREHGHHADIELHRHALSETKQPRGFAQRRAWAEVDRQRNAHGWGLKKEMGSMDYERAEQIMRVRLEKQSKGPAQPGEVREWKAGKFMKQPDGSWTPVPDSHPQGRHFHEHRHADREAIIGHAKNWLGEGHERVKQLQAEHEARSFLPKAAGPLWNEKPPKNSQRGLDVANAILDDEEAAVQLAGVPHGQALRNSLDPEHKKILARHLFNVKHWVYGIGDVVGLKHALSPLEYEHDEAVDRIRESIRAIERDKRLGRR